MLYFVLDQCKIDYDLCIMKECSLLTRDFTVAVFVVRNDRVLIMLHPKLGKLLPPGGHIEPNELPDQAALREVREETGLEVRLVGETALSVDNPVQLARPEGIQLEDIAPGHQHVDLIYFAVPLDASEPQPGDGVTHLRWYTPEELLHAGASEEIVSWSRQAVATTADRLADSRTSMH